jgi:hypothetical protein
VALLTGPYRWAASLRHRVATIAGVVAGTVRAAATGTGTGADDDRRVAWLTAHRDALQVAGIVAAIALLLVFDLSWLGIIVLIVVIGAYELVLWRLPPEPIASP